MNLLRLSFVDSVAPDTLGNQQGGRANGGYTDIT
jgi:hypothetical protein